MISDLDHGHLDENSARPAGIADASPGPVSRSGLSLRGASFIAGFWLVIVALVGARVAMFDAIAAARATEFASAQIAWLSTVLAR